MRTSQKQFVEEINDFENWCNFDEPLFWPIFGPGLQRPYGTTVIFLMKTLPPKRFLSKKRLFNRRARKQSQTLRWRVWVSGFFGFLIRRAILIRGTALIRDMTIPHFFFFKNSLSDRNILNKDSKFVEYEKKPANKSFLKTQPSLAVLHKVINHPNFFTKQCFFTWKILLESFSHLIILSLQTRQFIQLIVYERLLVHGGIYWIDRNLWYEKRVWAFVVKVSFIYKKMAFFSIFERKYSQFEYQGTTAFPLWIWFIKKIW